jgi:hypothetical protein
VKDLSNYFSDWVHVVFEPRINNPGDVVFMSRRIDTIDEWCGNNIGIRGLMWDRFEKVIPYGVHTRGGKMTMLYRFKREEDAMMYVLTHGGKVYKDQ